MIKGDVINPKECTGCMTCRDICPVHAITVEENKEGFQYPKIDEEICVHCNLCTNICPVFNNNKIKKQEIKVYYCKNKNDDVRIKSSSGGLFTLIAKHILEENGVVFGAKLTNNFEVIHDYIEKEDELKYFRGSKYVQSKIGDNYKKAKQFLEDGRKVLFTGTPCQIEGLLAYLRKDYNNLYTQDIICHGVPSPKVWKKYVEYKREKNSQKLIDINFRRKDLLGWSNYQMSYQYENSEENTQHREDPYMKLFLKNIDLRNSCYRCSFKKIERNSDITLADCWGINSIDSEFNDEKGISVLIIYSSKGKEIFNKIKKDMEFREFSINQVIEHNSPICKSVQYNPIREEFFEELDKNDFDKIIEKFL